MGDEEKRDLEAKTQEGMFPELAPVKVTINENWCFNVIEMPVFYVMQLNRLLAPFYPLFTGGFDGAKMFDADFIDRHYKEILEAAYLVANYHMERERFQDCPVEDEGFWEKKKFLQKNKKVFSKEYLSIHCSERVLLKIVYAQLEANGHVSFFKLLLKGVIQAAAVVANSSPSTQ